MWRQQCCVELCVIIVFVYWIVDVYMYVECLLNYGCIYMLNVKYCLLYVLNVKRWIFFELLMYMYVVYWIIDVYGCGALQHV